MEKNKIKNPIIILLVLPIRFYQIFISPLHNSRNKNIAMASVHKNVNHVYPAILKNLETPSLYDEVIKLLQRRGYNISSEYFDRDWTKKYQPHESIEQAWLEIYKTMKFRAHMGMLLGVIALPFICHAITK